MDEKIERPDDEETEGHRRVVADVTTEDDAEGHTHVILNAPDDDDVEGQASRIGVTDEERLGVRPAEDDEDVQGHRKFGPGGFQPDEGGESHPRM